MGAGLFVRSLESARSAPLGFDGEFRMIHLVFGVIAASRSPGVILKPLAMVVCTGTGVAPASSTISG